MPIDSKKSYNQTFGLCDKGVGHGRHQAAVEYFFVRTVNTTTVVFSYDSTSSVLIFKIQNGWTLAEWQNRIISPRSAVS